MKFLVTGGSGFVGSNLADTLIAAGHEVIVIDHHAREKKRFPNPKAVTHKVGFADPATREVLLSEKPDVVVHLAAQISVTKSIANPVFDTKRNVLDSLQLFAWAKEAGVKKIVFASSGGAIYGDHAVHPTPLVTQITPLTPYGIGKLAVEEYLEASYKNDGQAYVALRFSNLYGPRQQVIRPLMEGNVISLMLQKLIETGEPLVVFGDGSSTRDYLYIDDVISAIVAAATQPYVGVVNVGTATQTSVNDLIKTLLAIHGRDHAVQYDPARPGETKHSVLSYASAQEKLGWEPRVMLADGLQRTYAWYKETFGS